MQSTDRKETETSYTASLLASCLGIEWCRIVPVILSLLVGLIAISFTPEIGGNPSHNCEDSIHYDRTILFGSANEIIALDI